MLEQKLTSMLDLEITNHQDKWGSNSGVDENGNTVIETNAGSHVPSVSEMIKVTITSN